MEYNAASQKNELDLYTQRVEKHSWSIVSWAKSKLYNCMYNMIPFLLRLLYLCIGSIWEDAQKCAVTSGYCLEMRLGNTKVFSIKTSSKFL